MQTERDATKQLNPHGLIDNRSEKIKSTGVNLIIRAKITFCSADEYKIAKETHTKRHVSKSDWRKVSRIDALELYDILTFKPHNRASFIHPIIPQLFRSVHVITLLSIEGGSFHCQFHVFPSMYPSV